MSEYTLSPLFENSKLVDYEKLFFESFAGDGKLSGEYLDWQYLKNPDGQAIGFDAHFNGDLVAHYSIIPRTYSIDGVKYLGALSVNTATHPGHQGKGLFIKLAKATYDLAKERGVNFVIGVANANSVGGFIRKLGFNDLGSVRLYLGVRKNFFLANKFFDISLNDDWCKWRLNNPSRIYRCHSFDDNRVLVYTNVKNIRFNLGLIDKIFLNESIKVTNFDFGFGLTPNFGGDSTIFGRIPLRMQPSPWHVISKKLNDDFDQKLFDKLRLNGLSMDTF